MLESIITKDFKLNIKNLSFLEPYWHKEMNSVIKKLNKYINKFNATNYLLPILESYSDYNLFEKKIGYFNDFFMTKYAEIKKDLVTIRKFSKFITDYMYILGNIGYLKIVSEYYDWINKTEIKDKKDFFINLINNEGLRLFNIYRPRIFSLTKNDEYLEIIFNKLIITDIKIISFEFILRSVIDYSIKLFKKKVINNDELTKIQTETLEIAGYISGLNDFVYGIIDNIY